MIDYLNYFFNFRHLFGLRPAGMSLRAVIILAVIFVLTIAFGVASKIIARRTKDGLKVKAYRRCFDLGLTMGILGLIYIFFAWQGVTLLSARFWLLIWFISLAGWLGFIFKYLLYDIPKLRKNIDQKRKFEQYLP
ncbi:MAG: hypothetical protein RB292_04950 [Patescibacteria group bacterium]|jgi:hypothetical protein|nr:hypothetical protein [Patescibacteria group bacterium]